MAFELPALPYAHDALGPYMSQETLEFHHDKHHQTYVTNLNNLIKDTPLSGKSLEDLVPSTYNVADKAGVFNNASQHWNHIQFWEMMKPNGGGAMPGELEKRVVADFGSVDAFKTAFSTAAATQFGSGWAWLCVHKGGKVEVCSTPNQDNPLMPGVSCGGTPVLGLDVWEHAYYLNYQNRRPDYINAFFNVINWSEVAKRFEAAK